MSILDDHQQKLLEIMGLDAAFLYRCISEHRIQTGLSPTEIHLPIPTGFKIHGVPIHFGSLKEVCTASPSHVVHHYRNKP